MTGGIARSKRRPEHIAVEVRDDQAAADFFAARLAALRARFLSRRDGTSTAVIVTECPGLRLVS